MKKEKKIIREQVADLKEWEVLQTIHNQAWINNDENFLEKLADKIENLLKEYEAN